MNNADIPLRVGVAWAQNAGPTYITNPIPQVSQIGILNGAASWNDGFPPLTLTPLPAGGVPPFGQDENGVLFAISSWIKWYNAGGPIGYDSAFATSVAGYPAGATLSSNTMPGIGWFNQIDANGTNPDAGGSNWLGFSPLDLMAGDDGSGGVNAVVASLPVNPPSWAFMNGRPFLIRKTGVNTGACTIILNTLTPAKVLTHPDGSNLSANELADGGWFTAVYDLTNDTVQLQSQAGAVTPTTFPLQNGATKAWVAFYWSGSAVVVRGGYNVASVVRSSLGTYVVTLSGGMNFAVGYAMANGGGGNTGLRGPGGAIGIGSSFFGGPDPSFNVYFGNCGGSGGALADPTDAAVTVFGELL